MGSLGGWRLHHRDVVAVRVAQHEQQRGAGGAHRLRVDVDTADGTEPLVRTEDVRRLDTDPGGPAGDDSRAPG